MGKKERINREKRNNDKKNKITLIKNQELIQEASVAEENLNEEAEEILKQQEEASNQNENIQNKNKQNNNIQNNNNQNNNKQNKRNQNKNSQNKKNQSKKEQNKSNRQRTIKSEERKAKAALLTKQADEKGEQDFKELLEEEEKELDFMETRLRKGNQVQIEELAVILVLVIICILLFYWQHQIDNQLEEAKRVIGTLDSQVAEYKQKEEDWNSLSVEMQEQIQLLSDTVTSKTEQLTIYQDAEKAMHVPSGYPVRGTNSILSGGFMDDSDILPTEEMDDNNVAGEEDNNEDGEGIEEQVEVPASILFQVFDGTCITATGTGVVVDSFYREDGLIELHIDHENGYESIYKGVGLVFVNVGDSVSSGSVLMSITEEGSVFEYQIIYEGNYINPKECMVING